MQSYPVAPKKNKMYWFIVLIDLKICNRYLAKKDNCWQYMKLVTLCWRTCSLSLIGMLFLSFYLGARCIMFSVNISCVIFIPSFC